MTSLAMVLVFVLASLAGAWAARAGDGPVRPPHLAMISAMASIVVVGALIGGAESSDAIARYLSFAGIILAAAAGVGGFSIAERLNTAPGEDEGEDG